MLVVINLAMTTAITYPTGDAFLDAFPESNYEIDNDVHPLDTFDLEPLSQMEDGECVADDDAALQAMVDTEDAHHEAGLTFIDVRDDKLNSAKEKEKNALKHLNYFMKHHAKQRKYTFVRAQELDFEATEQNNAWWDDMIGCFFTYLSLHARCYCDPDKERISYNSASGYASSVKSYFSNKFRTRVNEIPVFQTERWKALRVKLLARYEDDNRNSGKSLVNPHEASNRTDREAIATGCIWLNSPQGAEFWHINVTMTQYSGRGSEVALDRRSKMGTTEVSELHYRYNILQSKLKRHKHGKEQLLSIYPHRDSVHQDYYFSLFYRIIMVADDDDFIFPEFARKARKQTEAKSDSRVSSMWSAYFADLYKSFACLSEKINQTLTSHCHKKGASQLMAETPSVSGLAQIFRTGWEVRGFHTIFDYIVGSTVMQQQAGKAMSGWTAKVADIVVGGQPPNLRDIHTEPHLLGAFISHLFIHDAGNNWSPLIRELLVASMLRHYDEFCSILQTEPDGKFACLENHLFVATIQERLAMAGVSNNVFDAWRKEVQVGFFNRNLPALAIQNFPRHLGDVSNPFHQVMVDPRCFIDHFNSLAAHYMGLHSQVSQQQTAIGNLTSLVRNLQGQVQSQNDLLARLTVLLETGQPTVHPVSPSVSGSPAKLSPSSSTDGSTVEAYVKRFSVAARTLGKGCSISDRFVFFFAECARAGYEKDKAVADIDAKERTKIRNDFTRLKRTVKLMLLFCDSYPGERPSDPAELPDWLASVRLLGCSAEASIKQRLYPDQPEKVMSQSAIAAKNVTNKIKEWEDSASVEHRTLPGNMPEETREWFSTERTTGKKRKRNNEEE